MLLQGMDRYSAKHLQCGRRSGISRSGAVLEMGMIDTGSGGHGVLTDIEGLFGVASSGHSCVDTDLDY